MLIYVHILASHVITLVLLGVRRAGQPPYQRNPSFSPPPWMIRTSAVYTAVLTVVGVAMTSAGDPLSDAGVRAAAFFYAIKILDLGLVHADIPPTRMTQDGDSRKPAPMNSITDFAIHVWKLLSQWRYFSFDIAVRQYDRDAKQEAIDYENGRLRSWSRPGNLIPALLIPLATWTYPCGELLALCLLLAIQISFEVMHGFLHPGCAHPLFDRPFMAASMGEFWASRWHAFASSTLRNLAYNPVRQRFGRMLGVLATFALSGVWHAYAGAVVSDSPRLPWLVFGFFVLCGVVCILERAIWGEAQGGLTQRITVWLVAVLAAGYCFRELQCHSRIEYLKKAC